MQEARSKARLIAALALVAGAGVARAQTSRDLSLEQVDGFLRGAGVTSAWSVSQQHTPETHDGWVIDAYGGREALGGNLCRTQFVELELSEHDGSLSVDRTDGRTQYALAPCAWAAPGDFHDIAGKFDPAGLERDFAVIVQAIKGDPAVKVRFKKAAYRAAFAALRRTDITDIVPDKDGHLQVCFISGLVDEQGAMETLSAEVTGDNRAEVSVDMCGTIDVTATPH